jgi:hypothetical protein
MSDHMRERWWEGLDDDARSTYLAYTLSGVMPESIWQHLVGSARRPRRRRRPNFGEYELPGSYVDFVRQRRRGW